MPPMPQRPQSWTSTSKQFLFKYLEYTLDFHSTEIEAHKPQYEPKLQSIWNRIGNGPRPDTSVRFHRHILFTSWSYCSTSWKARLQV